jgi:hypothetical protein
MQPDLKSQLEDAARVSGRSLNAEIIARLEATFPAGVEDEVRAARQSELQKLRASHRHAISDLETYRARLESGDTSPYGEDWMREVLLQSEYRVNRLERMIARTERELVELRKEDVSLPLPAQGLVAELEAKINIARRELANLKSLLPDATAKERAGCEKDIAQIEAAITEGEQAIRKIKARSATHPPPNSEVTARRAAVEKDP